MPIKNIPSVAVVIRKDDGDGDGDVWWWWSGVLMLFHFVNLTLHRVMGSVPARSVYLPNRHL